MKLLIFLTEQETKEFSCWAEFLAWKENEEVISHCHFVQPTGKTSSAKSQIKTCMLISVVMHLISDEKCTVVYTCCLDGGYKGCDQERKTSKKRNSKESRKLPREKFCLAGMTAKEDLKTGAVTVICDCILENRPFCHISYFEKYRS